MGRMSIQGVQLPFAKSSFLLIIPTLFLFSSRLEKSRVMTISKPLVITQFKKTPAFILYQQAQLQERKPAETIAAPSTYIGTESLSLLPAAVIISEMKFSHQEIGSAQDFGFQVEAAKKTSVKSTLASILPEVPQTTNQLNSSPLKKWGTVRGKFEVKDGVGIVDHSVEIKRIEEGQVRELGRVDLQAGSYSIDIENPQGILIAQIKDKNGVIIGEDEQRMINLQSQGSYFEGPFIRVGKPLGIATYPVIPAPAPHLPTVANNGRGKNQNQPANALRQQKASPIVASLFSTQHQLESPQDQFQNISKNSSTISIIQDQKKVHEAIITIRQTGDISETPLFTKKWLQGAKAYIADQMKIEFKNKSAPVLIGKVLRDGKASAGIKVVIENQPGVAAVYLDQFLIPSLKLESTSENGLFMFVGLEADSYSVTAFLENALIGQQVFLAEEGFVSYQHISSSTHPRSVIVRAFDAFSGEPQDADVIIPDNTDIIETASGRAAYRTHNQLGVANYIVRAKQSYMPINYIQDSRKDHVHFPLITEEWVASLQSQLQINDQPATGTIVGFVPDVEFEIYLATEDYDLKQIAYFAPNGSISSAPIAGGGFILFNVPSGAQEVIVQDKKSERIFSQVHLVKINQTSVSHFND